MAACCAALAHTADAPVVSTIGLKSLRWCISAAACSEALAYAAGAPGYGTLVAACCAALAHTADAPSVYNRVKKPYIPKIIKMTRHF